MRDEPLPDDGPIARAMDGDREAFATLVRTYRPLVLGLARRFRKGREACEELAQETFYRAWVALPRLRDPRSFKTWLGRITVNTALEKRGLPHTESLDAEGAESKLPSDSRQPEHASLGREARELLEAALAKLGERLRAAFHLRVCEGMSHREIAEVMGTTIETSRMYVCRARERLARELAPHRDLLRAMEAAS